MAQLGGSDDRVVIVGSTGQGKTVFAVWYLMVRWRARRCPVYIIDYKGDKLLRQIPAEELKVGGKIPTKPGLYIIRPIPQADDAAVEAFLVELWHRGNCILYIDEAYMLPGNGMRGAGGSAGFNALLTQGRSKHIEMLILSQRPVWMSRFVWSEGTYFAVFSLTSRNDRKTVKDFVPFELDNSLERFHCVWYDVNGRELSIFTPAPPPKEIIAGFGVKNTSPDMVVI